MYTLLIDHDIFEIMVTHDKCIVFSVVCIYRSLGKIQRERIFVGRHVRRKLNTQKFSYQKEIE